MKYTVNKNNLRKVISQSLPKLKGKYFSALDEFHPAYIPLFSLFDKINPLLRNNSYEQVVEIIDEKIYGDHYGTLSKNNFYKMQVEWKTREVKIWVPFNENNHEFYPIQSSMSRWTDLGYVKKIKFDKELTPNISQEDWEEKKKIYMQTWNQIFLIFGELYANSVTHGYAKHSNLASEVYMSSSITHNADDSVDLLHCDIGMTITGNIKLNVPEKVKNMSDMKILRWSSMMGNSSKGENVPVKGGGMSVLKDIILFDKNNRVVCFSGNHVMEFKMSDKLDFSAIDSHDLDATSIDDLVSAKIEKTNFNLPGTVWWMHIAKPETAKEAIEKNAKFLEKRKKYINEKLKGYII